MQPTNARERELVRREILISVILANLKPGRARFYMRGIDEAIQAHVCPLCAFVQQAVCTPRVHCFVHDGRRHGYPAWSALIDAAKAGGEPQWAGY